MTIENFRLFLIYIRTNLFLSAIHTNIEGAIKYGFRPFQHRSPQLKNLTETRKEANNETYGSNRILKTCSSQDQTITFLNGSIYEFSEIRRKSTKLKRIR